MKNQDEHEAVDEEEAWQAFSTLETATPTPTASSILTVMDSVLEPTQTPSKFTQAAHSHTQPT